MTVLELNAGEGAGRGIRRVRGGGGRVGGGPRGGRAEAVEEKTEFDAILKEVGPEKIKVIKAVRELTGWASRKPRTWWTARPSPSRRAFPRKTRKRSPPRSRKSARRRNQISFAFAAMNASIAAIFYRIRLRPKVRGWRTLQSKPC